MKKIRLDDCICKTPIVDHSRIKDKILSEIDNTFGGVGDQQDSYGKDSRISKLDWDNAVDWSRPWFKIFYPHWVISVKEMLSNMAYSGRYALDKMWYQQYEKGSNHSWHIHSNHFTGVYYLEFPKGSAKTEICSPYSLTVKKIDALEGDIIIFPSHWIHRAPSNNSVRKTIVSFNFDTELSDPNINLIKGGKPYILF